MTSGPGDGARMPLPRTPSGYALGPDDGEALWFNGGLGLLKATAEQTEVGSRRLSCGSPRDSPRRFTSTRTRTSSSSCSPARFGCSTVTMSSKA